MKYNVCSKLLMVTVFIFLIISCNNQSENNNKELAETSSKVKTEMGNIPPFDTSRSVTVISPDLYKELSDTLNIRILKGTYKPGDSSIMHAHPDFALYVLEGSMVELTSIDGKKQNIEFKKDMAVVLPAATHSAKNIGKNTLSLIVVEVKRPRD